MTREAFYTLMEKCMPRAGRVPFAALPWTPRVHLVLFVHRVEGLEPGAYALLRDEASGQRLRGAMSDALEWTRPAGCPQELELYLLKAADLRAMSAAVSCQQEIASDGAFSLGMLADFEGTLADHGAWMYPRLFWECGVIGQVLYLEAEAAGAQGTGIGCFFDDSVHAALGLGDHQFQSLYHFTVGTGVVDTRITTLPPY